MSDIDPNDSTRTHNLIAHGTVIDSYRILEKIGAGGMGEVYLADDTKLDRKVALKFLPSHLVANNELQQRFHREAKAAARLNHPNIVTVHDFGDFSGTPFLVMEYVPGHTLLLNSQGPSLTIDDTVDLALQISQGLAEAHRTGIVHRDVKPGNIVVDQSGRVRILDFGLAALSDSEELTKSGSTLGTVSYMSPEQVSGRNVDRRSDIFSFGILLYELITGKNPFKRNNDGATLRAIIDSEPDPLSRLRPDTPERLEHIVMKALEKDVELRYQSCEDMIADLKKLLYDSQQGSSTGTKVQNDDKSIVIVPFRNLSADPENEYFSDGLTEEIITDLSSVGKLRVISRSSSNQLKGTQKSSRVIGNELGVRYILTGSVRKAANSVRITAQLVEAATDTQVWAGKYTGSLEDVFEMQENVSRAIVDTLKVELTRDEDREIAARPIADVRAYEYYLKARQDINTWSEDALARAESYLKAGIEIIGENALLYAALGWVYAQYVNIGARHDDWIEVARDLADKAIALDPSVSEGYHIKGIVAVYFDGAVLDGIVLQRQALARDPNNSDALFQLAFDLTMIGHKEEVTRLADQLQAIDPLTQKSNAVRAWIAYISGDFERHLELRLKMRAIDSMRLTNLTWVAAAYMMVGDWKSAAEAMKGIEPDNFAARMTTIFLEAHKGNTRKALELITPEFEKTAYRDPQFSQLIAGAFTTCGEFNRGLDALEQAVAKGFWNYPFLSEIDPFLAPLRDLPRFRKIMQDLKTKWQNALEQPPLTKVP